jgi:hypothetical protein
MNADTLIRETLDGLAGQLPTVPPQSYVEAGRAAHRARRRRRAVGGACLVASVVVAAGAVSVLTTTPPVAEDRTQTSVAPAHATRSVLSHLTVQAGVGDIDSFTTEDIPEWAQEFGNHGPVTIAPDGRLWIAPDAEVVRTVNDPYGDAGREIGIARSFAVETRWHNPRNSAGDGGLAWSFVYQDAGSSFTQGSMDTPDRYTTDFGLWAEDQTAFRLEQPGSGERLVHFASSTSDVLEPGAEVEIVQQAPVATVGTRPPFARQVAAEVRIADETWFVLASGKITGREIYEPYEPALSGSDFAGFLAFVSSGFEPEAPAS